MKGTRRIGLVVLLPLLAVLPASIRAAQKSAAPTSELHFLILKGENGRPIRNASVVLHPLDNAGREKGSLQLKTGSDGQASVDGIAYGRWRVQVIAHGFRTFGEDYEVKQPALDFKIEMKPPKEQLSIY
jgi:hypothetical protein